MFSKAILFFFTFYFNLGFCQDLIVLDNETLEFVEDVNFSLYQNKSKIYSGICSNSSKTTLPIEIAFDSISFSKVNYRTQGFSKSDLQEVVFLTKMVFSLDEVVITSSKNNEILLGEKNRFVKKMSNGMTRETSNGLVFKNSYESDIQIDKVVFYIEKATYKTLYKIKFFEFNQDLFNEGFQYANLGSLIYETDSLTIEPNQKGKVEVILQGKIQLSTKPIFVSLQLIDYVDETGSIAIDLKNTTKVKHQLSNLTNYFAKRADLFSGILEEKMTNINAVIKYDFAVQYFKKPHKSILVAPAVLLSVSKL